MPRIPFRWLYPAIIIFVCLGVYSVRGSTFAIGAVGYALTQAAFKSALLLSDFVLGPPIETNLRRAPLQPQLADMAHAVEPMRVRPGQRGQMAFEVEAWNGVVGLGLQPHGLEPPIGRRAQGLHPPPLQQIGDQRG